VAAAVARFGRIDCAFNNAGIEEEQLKLAESDEALYDRMMAINVKGVWLCMRRQIKQMLAQGGGAIVNTARSRALVGAPRHAIYAGEQARRGRADQERGGGVRQEEHPHQFGVPGVIRTAMLERALERDPNWEAGILALHPVGRLGEVGDVVSAVLWLCSDARPSCAATSSWSTAG
jgi:NAD(P)-dependent dehydrogenase (short-subunit alcohol dehydrogenase family)